MSSVLGVTKDLMWSKFKLVSWVILLNLVELAIVLPTGILKQKWVGYGEGVLVASACLVYFLGLILLTNDNERILFSSRYRLIPIDEAKLYFSNLVTNCLAYLYLVIVTTGLFIISSYTLMKSDIFLHFMIYDDKQSSLLISDLVISVLAVLLIWTGSTLIHLLMNYLSDSWEVKHPRIMSLVLKIVIIGLASAVIFYTLTRMSVIGMNRYNEIPNHVFEWVSVIDLIVIILSITLGLHLLKNYSETSE